MRYKNTNFQWQPLCIEGENSCQMIQDIKEDTDDWCLVHTPFRECERKFLMIWALLLHCSMNCLWFCFRAVWLIKHCSVLSWQEHFRPCKACIQKELLGTTEEKGCPLSLQSAILKPSYHWRYILEKMAVQVAEMMFRAFGRCSDLWSFAALVVLRIAMLCENVDADQTMCSVKGRPVCTEFWWCQYQWLMDMLKNWCDHWWNEPDGKFCTWRNVKLPVSCSFPVISNHVSTPCHNRKYSCTTITQFM